MIFFFFFTVYLCVAILILTIMILLLNLLEASKLYRMFSPSLELKGPNMFQHDHARSMKTWFAESGVKKLDWPAQSPDVNPTELCGELERRLHPRRSHLTSTPDLTNNPVSESTLIPRNLVESLPKRTGCYRNGKRGLNTKWERLKSSV